MIFLCFSSKDRYDIIESVYYHLTNIGLPIWYDRKEILMGDDRNYKNFIEGVSSCNYAIIILSPNAINSFCANEEIDLIYEQYKKHKTYVFPVFYNITAPEIPAKYSWMQKLVYKELNVSIDSRGLCNHVICKYLLDQIENCTFKTLSEITETFNGFMAELLTSYQQIDGHNFNSKISLLYAGILYMHNQKKLPDYCIKGTTYLFEETKLNLPIDLRETIIFERLFILASNYFLR